MRIDTCTFCGTLSKVADVYTSRLNRNEVQQYAVACKRCCKKMSHPKDYFFFNAMWCTQFKENRRELAIERLEKLIQSNPGKRIYQILKELLYLRIGSGTLYDAINRIASGKKPNKNQYRSITAVIRGYRNGRIGVVRRVRTQHDHFRIYPSTGSSGLF